MSEHEPEALHREVSVRIAEGGDGRTLEAMLVPYNQAATVSDGGEPYQEMFMPGAFNAQLGAAHRIKAFLNFRHRQGLQDVIGHAKSISDTDGGLHGELRVLEVPDGDKALALVRAGVLDRLSIEFVPKKSKTVDGIVQRVSARLLGVALVPEGAYEGAQILAVREQDEDDEPEVKREIPPLAPLNPELVEGLEKLGLRIDTANVLNVKAKARYDVQSGTATHQLEETDSAPTD